MLGYWEGRFVSPFFLCVFGEGHFRGGVEGAYLPEVS